MKVLSTYKILKAKAFNENLDEHCVEWAIEMIEAGYESDSFYMLAGMIKPYNQFELQELITHILRDLQIDYSNKEIVLRSYIYFLLSTSINHPETYTKTLRELRDMYCESAMDSRLTDFYLLFYAKDDLRVDEVQWYWDGADRGNIDKIIKEHFQNWISEFEQEQTKITA